MTHRKRKIVFAVLALLPGLAAAPVVYFANRGSAPLEPVGTAGLVCPNCMETEYASIEALGPPAIGGAQSSMQTEGPASGRSDETPRRLSSSVRVEDLSHYDFADFGLPDIRLADIRMPERVAEPVVHAGNFGIDRPLRLAWMGGGAGGSSPHSAGHLNSSDGGGSGGHGTARTESHPAEEESHSQSSETVATEPAGDADNAAAEEPAAPQEQTSETQPAPSEDPTAMVPETGEEEMVSILSEPSSEQTEEGQEEQEEHYEQPPVAQPPPVAVPEPGTLALFSLGLIGLGLGMRRRTS